MKSQTAEIREALTRLTFENRENNFRHHTYNDDMLQYEYMKRGDMEAIPFGRKLFEGGTTGTLSDDPVRNYQYLFVCSATLASRFCIEGGMDSETAFNMSDVYIRKCDKCTAVQDIFDLRVEMFRDYTTKMQEINRSRIYSLPVSKVISYVEGHLHEPISLAQLAEEVGLSPAYLSTVFKKEMRVSVSEYIRGKRLDAAELLLVYSDFPCADIAEYLAFSSNSHFTHLFKERTGETPLAYRNAHHASHWTE